MQWMQWMPWMLICAVYLDCIITIHFVRPYLNLLTFYVHYTQTLAIEKGLIFELICAVDLEFILTIHFVHPYPNLLTLYGGYSMWKLREKHNWFISDFGLEKSKLIGILVTKIPFLTFLVNFDNFFFILLRNINFFLNWCWW